MGPSLFRRGFSKDSSSVSHITASRRITEDTSATLADDRFSYIAKRRFAGAQLARSRFDQTSSRTTALRVVSKNRRRSERSRDESRLLLNNSALTTNINQLNSVALLNFGTILPSVLMPAANVRIAWPIRPTVS